MKSRSNNRKPDSKIRIHSKIKKIDWSLMTRELNEKGFAVAPRLLSVIDCKNFLLIYDQPSLYRKTITMERYRFGSGEYKYFDYPLPDSVQNIREYLYPYLAPIANVWMRVLKIDKKFPDQLSEFQNLCRNNGQSKPTPLVLKYGAGGFNTLHRDLYGDVYFPIQAAIFLNEPDQDYEGGE
ncbi:2OG-Fe(II) oxygenase [Leptospira adleri]|uniref:Proline hydroxylase n=1 Tax=Leptospira adleri TaxID=2023186 RepID=A0A2M9YL73_9LEPT|nr:2OG-Fe(II) oxygenase [Leptospira adleri]PJZ52247.1 hypothetical protein CH380_16475 [Leptospira adleri]PJZ59689.1 hypothetical protein CH376_22340 [Leptospira adleri]